MSFEQILEPAINLAENGFPLGESSAEDIANTKKILKYPTTIKICLPDGRFAPGHGGCSNPPIQASTDYLVGCDAEVASL